MRKRLSDKNYKCLIEFAKCTPECNTFETIFTKFSDTFYRYLHLRNFDLIVAIARFDPKSNPIVRTNFEMYMYIVDGVFCSVYLHTCPHYT